MTPPSRIYRFLRPDRTRIESVLRDFQLYFSKPEDLDDPFEFKPRHIVVKKFKRITPCNPKWEDALDSGMLEGIEEVSKKRTADLAGLGVCCFSAALHEPLMWSHYADGHKGIAVEFDASHSFFSRLLPVTYSNERRDVGIKFSAADLVRDVLLVKSANWEYQHEWRLLNAAGGCSCEIPRDAVTGVIFGAKCSSDTSNIVSTALDGAPVKLVQAAISSHSFRLEFTDV